VRAATTKPAQHILFYSAYCVSLVLSISLWFIAIRSPLWLDETISYCQIHSGLLQIWSHAGLSFPAYSYILWFFTKILGTSEVALRVPSILAMLGAVYLLYLAARELFDRETAMVAIILFSSHPIVIAAAIDARPYAFGALAICAAVYLLVRLRHSDSTSLAAGLGVVAAVIVWFHFLFVVTLPALLISFFAIKLVTRVNPFPQHGRPTRSAAIGRQFGVAVVGFTLAFLPVIPGLLYMFRTRGEHSFAPPASFVGLLWTFMPLWFVHILLVTFFIALMIAAWASKTPTSAGDFQLWRTTFCGSLALVPVLILFGVGRETPYHVFLARYCLAAAPGIALLWAQALGGLTALAACGRRWPRLIMPLFCLAVVTTTARAYFAFPAPGRAGYTWKYALEVAERNATMDNAPVLICSDLPESDHMPLPVGNEAKDNNLFAPLSYYKLTVPVVPLPRSLDEEAMRLASSFLQGAAQRHQRFLAMAFIPSYGTLDWLANGAAGKYNMRDLGTFDGVKVIEFTPRPQ